MNPGTDITTGDRLSVTTVFSILVHTAIILGLTFDINDPEDLSTLPSLDVIVVQRQSPEEPNEADYLAQASQVGGGTSIEKVRPTSPVTSQLPKPDPGEAPIPVRQSIPEPSPQTPPEVLSQNESERSVTVTPETPLKQTDRTPTAQELIERSMEIARLEAEIGRDLEAYAKRPRRKFISANTREYAYASYMQAWVAKVERIGNLNYPMEARRRNLLGSLVLTVAINRAGEVDNVRVIESSGYRVLDEAAIQIVRMGGPYAPLPQEDGERVDILHITRTWQFLPGSSFSGQES